jgi:hypothetical protein
MPALTIAAILVVVTIVEIDFMTKAARPELCSFCEALVTAGVVLSWAL